MKLFDFLEFIKECWVYILILLLCFLCIFANMEYNDNCSDCKNIPHIVFYQGAVFNPICTVIDNDVIKEYESSVEKELRS